LYRVNTARGLNSVTRAGTYSSHTDDNKTPEYYFYFPHVRPNCCRKHT